MIKYFDVILSSEAKRYLDSLEIKVNEKIISNIEKAEYTLNPKLFKKTSRNIWEFKTRYARFQYRLMAFWDGNDGRSRSTPRKLSGNNLITFS